MKTSNVRPRRPKRRFWVWALLLLLILGLVAPLTVFAVYYSRSLGFDVTDVAAMPQRATVFDMDAKPYARLYGENRLIVPLKAISPNFVNALLAREDARFFSHKGVDPVGIIRAAYNNVTRSRKEGASTLTQQLARNSLPLGGRTLDRKLLEACIALRIERTYSKDEILTHYMNRIYYGAGLYGIEAASLAYFGKHAKDLDLSEAATLAGIIRSPNRFSPLKNPKGAEGNRNDVLLRMVAVGKLTPAEAEAARKEPIATTTGRPKVSFQQENYAMDAIKRDLDTILETQQQEDGGLQIYSTIDPQLQALASKALEETLAKIEAQPGWEHPRRSAWKKSDDGSEQPTEYLQGAVVVIENRTGAIRALVGGREFSESKYNRAVLAKRQIGSSFKSFIYAEAFQRGMLPGMLVSDAMIEPGELKDGNGMQTMWSPANSDEKYNGLLPVADGLIRSRNTMSVRVGEMVGLPEVLKVVTAAGLTREVQASPTTYLGAFESNLKDLTAAYTAFPNGGVRRQPYLIERIDDAEGTTVYRAARQERRMFSEGAAWLTSSTLERVLVNGSAARARSELGFKLPAAGKTGTTNEFKDAWFVGYTSSLTCGVWVGLDRPTTIMRKGYGATLALPVWTSILGKASKDRYPALAFKPSEKMFKVRVCSVSNKLASIGCDSAGKSYEIELPTSMVPKEGCGTHMDAMPVARATAVGPAGNSGGSYPIPGAAPAPRSERPPDSPPEDRPVIPNPSAPVRAQPVRPAQSVDGQPVVRAEPVVPAEEPVVRAQPVPQGNRIDQRVGRTLKKFFGGGSSEPPPQSRPQPQPVEEEEEEAEPPRR